MNPIVPLKINILKLSGLTLFALMCLFGTYLYISWPIKLNILGREHQNDS